MTDDPRGGEGNKEGGEDKGEMEIGTERKSKMLDEGSKDDVNVNYYDVNVNMLEQDMS